MLNQPLVEIQRSARPWLSIRAVTNGQPNHVCD